MVDSTVIGVNYTRPELVFMSMKRGRGNQHTISLIDKDIDQGVQKAKGELGKSGGVVDSIFDAELEECKGKIYTMVNYRNMKVKAFEIGALVAEFEEGLNT